MGDIPNRGHERDSSKLDPAECNTGAVVEGCAAADIQTEISGLNPGGSFDRKCNTER